MGYLWLKPSLESMIKTRWVIFQLKPIYLRGRARSLYLFIRGGDSIKTQLRSGMMRTESQGTRPSPVQVTKPSVD